MASFKGKKCELTQKLLGMDKIFSKIVLNLIAISYVIS